MRQVLIVEDHPLVAEATGKLLARYGQGIATVVCQNVMQTVARLDEPAAEWFRIFLDLDVPGAYGLSLAKDIERRGLADRCCVVSAFENGDYIDEIRSCGFLGYIVKAMPVAEFTAAVVGILDGASSFPAMPLVRRTAPLRLTRRQTQLLELVQDGLSSKEIGVELLISEGTVNNQVAVILQVLQATGRTHAVAKAIELGLLETHPRAGGRSPRSETAGQR